MKLNESENKLLNRIIETIQRNEEGRTIDWDGRTVEDDAWAVGIKKHEHNPTSLDNLEEWVKRVWKHVDRKWSRAVGIWFDKKEQRYVLDVVELVKDKRDALVAAGFQEQKAIINLKTKQLIYV